MMQASNMFFYDIIHFGAGLTNSALFVTLPAISVAMFFVLAVFYLLRIYKHPDCKKRITRLYSIILLALAGLGVIGGVLSGLLVYKTFIGSHPFPGYVIIFISLNILLIGVGIAGLLLSKKMEDEGKVKINFLYVLKTIGWFLFICLTFNRLGTLLGAPFYIYLRNLYKTFPFYIYLMMPTFFGLLEVMHILEVADRKMIIKLAIVGLVLNVGYFGYIAAMGMTDTGFVSSLSQAMPLERMLSKPIELPIHFLAYTGVGIALLIQSKKKKEE